MIVDSPRGSVDPGLDRPSRTLKQSVHTPNSQSMSVVGIAVPRRGLAVAVERRLRGDWAPVVVFLAIGIFMALVAHAAGRNPFAAHTWAQWDSAYYESIARHGYVMEPCVGGADPHGVCGNAGWFPGYPLVMAVLVRIGVPLPAGGVVLSWLFSLATLILLWRTFLGRRASVGAIACLVFAACPPGAVFHYAEFPLAMNSFFMVLALWQLHNRRWLWAGVAGALACGSYVVGVVLAPVVLVWAACLGRDTPWRERVRRAALSGGVMGLGPLAVVAAMQLFTGHWNAYFMTQAKYQHHLVWPGVTFSRRLEPLGFSSGLERWAAPYLMIAVAIMMICLLVHVAGRARRMDATRWLILSLALVLWLFPLSQYNAPLWRSASVLLPAGLLLRDVPRWLAVAIAAAFIVLAAPIATLFVEGRLT
jgi:hypothetical protein